jgi:hypothetical protein
MWAYARTDTLASRSEMHREREKEMFGSQLEVEARIYEIERSWKKRPDRHFRGNPDAETPRTGVGLVHEVFRRIVDR